MKILLFIILVSCCYYHVKCIINKPVLGRPIQTTLNKTSSSDPSYYVKNNYCLSITKSLYRELTQESDDVYNIQWLISICNECPQYKLYDIVLNDYLEYIEEVSPFFELDVPLEATLVPIGPLATGNFMFPPFNLIDVPCNPLVPLKHCYESSNSMVSIGSILPPFNPNKDCECSELSCATMLLTVKFKQIGCTSTCGHLSNVISSTAVATQMYTNKMPSLFDISSQLSLNKSINVMGIDEKTCSFASANVIDDFCIDGSPVNLVIDPILTCSLSTSCDNQCKSCKQSRVECLWILPLDNSVKYPSFVTTTVFNPPITDNPVDIPPFCTYDGISTITCSIEGHPKTPTSVILKFSYCINEDLIVGTPVTFTALTDVTTKSICTTIKVEDDSFLLNVPFNQPNLFGLSSTNPNELLCTSLDQDLTYSSSVVMKVPPCVATGLLYSFYINLAPNTVLDTSSIVVSDPTVTCTPSNIIPTNWVITCVANTISPTNYDITVTYNSHVSCRQACPIIGNNPLDMITIIRMTEGELYNELHPYCPGSLIKSISTKLRCCPKCNPCKVDCACTGTLKATLNAADLLYPSQNSITTVAGNYLSCKLTLDSDNSLIGNFIFSGEQWLGYPYDSGNPLNREVIVVPVTGEYTISCCGNQQNGDNPITESSFVDFIDETGPHTVYSYTLDFTCTSYVVPSINPSRYVAFLEYP